MSDFFHDDLAKTDPDLAEAIHGEFIRQRDEIELIASENIVSKAVMQAQGSVLTNKYAEGYPGRRYYAGCEHVDVAESLAIERAKKLFNCSFINVQPHSGAQANQAVFLALLQPGDTFMGLDHLRRSPDARLAGQPVRQVVQTGSLQGDQDTNRIDMDEVRDLAKKENPKLIIAGGFGLSAPDRPGVPRDRRRGWRALFMVDMAHFAGLVAGGQHPNPLDHAHVVTTTTHKTLRGPRGGMILSNDEALGKKINSAVFPGSQGGPLITCHRR
ncbi:MAG: hypothetical protein R3D43_14725 [Tepidamorphaceae bacterium]